ncbi:MAG TPA: GspH/FimT family pseudopilin [Rhizobacter sp.]
MDLLVFKRWSTRRVGVTAGFTLVELMVTLAVMAILATLAAPSFFNMIATNRMANQTNELVAALNAAKSEAIRRAQPITVRANDDGNPNDFHSGWSTFTDADADGSPASSVTEADGTVLQSMARFSGNTTMTRVTRSGTTPNFTYAPATSSVSGRQFVTFLPRGGLSGGNDAFFRVCDSGISASNGRILRVSMVGRVSLESITAPCP